MFIEQLTTPCEGAGDTSCARPLAEAIGNTGADRNQADYKADVNLSYRVASIIRHSLRFKRDRGDLDYLGPAALAARPVTNCHGFTIVTSEALQSIGIDHYVGFSNCHSFVLLQDPRTGQTNLVDTADKPLCTDITSALVGKKRLGEGDRGRGTVHKILGNEILKSAVFENGLSDNQERDWLSFNSKSSTYLTKPSDPDRVADSILFLRAYKPEQGRQVVLNFNIFRHAMILGQAATAHLFLSKMGGTFPEIDKRNKLSLPSELIKFLGRGGFEAEAVEDIEVIEQSLTDFSGDIQLKLWGIDRRRDIGNYLGNKILLQEAINRYKNLAETIPESAVSQKLISGKIRKTEQLLSKTN